MVNTNGQLYFISSLPDETTEENLKQFFSPLIKLIDCKLTKTRNGIKKCYGYIRTCCSKDELQQYLKKKKFQQKQLEIDDIEEEKEDSNENAGSINSKKRKREENKTEIMKKGREQINLYKDYGNDINKNIYVDATDAKSIKSVNIINESGCITKHGLEILNHMNMYDIILLIEKIQSLIRLSPQTAIKLLTENKTVFYSLVHALFLLGILNIEISPLKIQELKRANFLKIKNRFQYLCFEKQNQEDAAGTPISPQPIENTQWVEQRNNKRNFESFTVHEERGIVKDEFYLYKRKRGQNEDVNEDTNVLTFPSNSFTQRYQSHGQSTNTRNNQLKNKNEDFDTNNGIFNNDNDFHVSSNNVNPNMLDNNYTNKNTNSISINNKDSRISKERAGNIMINKTTNSRNSLYNSNAITTTNIAATNSITNNNITNNNNNVNNNNDNNNNNNNNNNSSNNNNTGVNNYGKGVYSFNTSGGSNTVKKHKKEEHKPLYKIHDTFIGENEFHVKKKNNSSRLYLNKSFVEPDYGMDPYEDTGSNTYDNINSYKNTKPKDFVGKVPNTGSAVNSDPFSSETGEMHTNLMSNRNTLTNTFRNTYYNENGIEEVVGVGVGTGTGTETGIGAGAGIGVVTGTGTGAGGKEFLQRSASKSTESKKYPSGLYKKKMNKSAGNHNKNNKSVRNTSPPTLYNNCYNSKKTKNGNTYKNINMSIDNVQEMGSKVLYKGRYKEFYGGKFKNKTSSYTNNKGNPSDAPNSSSAKNTYTRFYGTGEERNTDTEFGNEVYEDNECNYNNKSEVPLYDKGNYGSNANVRKGSSTSFSFSGMNNFTNGTNFGSATNSNNQSNLNNNTSSNFNSATNFLNPSGNGGRNFNVIETEHNANNSFAFGNTQLYNQSSSSNVGNALHDTKKTFFNMDNRSKEGNEFNNVHNDVEETNEKQKIENIVPPREVRTNEKKDIIMGKEELSKNRYSVHFNHMEEEKKNRKKEKMFQNVQLHHMNHSHHVNTFTTITTPETRDSFNKNKEIKEIKECLSSSSKDATPTGNDEASKQPITITSEKRYIREIKGEENSGESVFYPLAKNENEKEKNKNKRDSQEKSSKNATSKSKSGGNIRRCINLIDRKNSSESVNTRSTIKLKNIEAIEKQNPLLIKKKEQSLINTHLKIILNKLKITLGAIPCATEGLVNEIINDENMLNNIVKMKYEDMLKWPNEQILRILSIRKALKQKGFPIIDII